jgi:fermentation-respiration switch protein FrsA (DUF1100 family)
MAGPGVPGDELILEQARLIAIASGAPADIVQRNVTEQRALLDIVKREKDNAALERALRERFSALGLPPGPADLQVKTLAAPWMRYFVSYDPAPALSALTCRVLAINGEKDLQVPPAQNLPALRRALSSNKAAQVEQIPGVNHLFQPAATGLPTEYVNIETTIASEVLEKISSWILGLRL